MRGHRLVMCRHAGQSVPHDQPLALTTSLEAARAAIGLLRPGLVNIGRFPQDHPTVAEVWL